jgi:hydrophobic/amphiphilic exporter-1 (mainly G- bacteria), HAE1 family
MQADSKFRLQPDDLLNLYVRSQDNQMVPIGAVAHLTSALAPALITLYNLYPSATIVGAPAPGYSSGQSMTIMEDIAGRTLPAGMSYFWTAMHIRKIDRQSALLPIRTISDTGLSLPCRAV